MSEGLDSIGMTFGEHIGDKTIGELNADISGGEDAHSASHVVKGLFTIMRHLQSANFKERDTSEQSPREPRNVLVESNYESPMPPKRSTESAPCRHSVPDKVVSESVAPGFFPVEDEDDEDLVPIFTIGKVAPGLIPDITLSNLSRSNSMIASKKTKPFGGYHTTNRGCTAKISGNGEDNATGDAIASNTIGRKSESIKESSTNDSIMNGDKKDSSDQGDRNGKKIHSRKSCNKLMDIIASHFIREKGNGVNNYKYTCVRCNVTFCGNSTRARLHILNTGPSSTEKAQCGNPDETIVRALQGYCKKSQMRKARRHELRLTAGLDAASLHFKKRHYGS